MATGDILSASVESEGWILSLTIEGMSTGGSYSHGLGTNNSIRSAAGGSPKLILTVVSQGYDSAGNTTTVTRTIYGTKLLRKAYPNDASNDETSSGGNLVLRIALSDVVYQSDTSLSLAVASGVYSNGGSSNSATVVPTNNSTRTPERCVANWTYPGRSLIFGTSITLRAVGFHGDSKDGKPLACMEFSVTDGVNTVSEKIVTPTIGSLRDPVKVVEYISTGLNLSSLNNGIITANFKAYPQVGDSACILDSSDGVNADGSPLYTSQKYYLVKSGTIPGCIAVVDDSGGAGSVVSHESFDPNSPPAAYSTIAAAAGAIRTYNNANHSHNTTAHSIIYLREGNYNFAGGSSTYGTTPDTWLVIKRFPNDRKELIVINNQSGNASVGGRTKFEDIVISTSTPAYIIDGGTQYWFDKCDIDYTRGSTAQLVGSASVTITWFVTHCNIRALKQGFRPISTHNCACAIVRGNVMSRVSPSTIPYVVVGNYKRNVASSDTGLITGQYGSMSIPVPRGWIIAYNKFMNMDLSSGELGSFHLAHTNSHGGAMVQNIFECARASSSPMFSIAGDGGAAVEPVNNMIIWYNLFLGQRINFAYNAGDNGTQAQNLPRKHWSVKGNIWDDISTKDDRFTGTGGANGVRLGAWEFSHRVKCLQNASINPTGVGTNNGFPAMFAGIESYLLASGTNVDGYAEFENQKSYQGTNQDGDGKYRLKSATSPFVGTLNAGWYGLPYDLDGVTRYVGEPPGPHAGTWAESSSMNIGT